MIDFPSRDAQTIIGQRDERSAMPGTMYAQAIDADGNTTTLEEWQVRKILEEMER